MTAVRLLAQDMFAGRERLHGPVVVQPIGQRYVNSVDGRVPQQLVVTGVPVRDVPASREVLGPLRVPAGDRMHLR